MVDFFEVDFVKAGEGKSGDAIVLRYQSEGESMQHHVVDGGYTSDGEKLVEHINTYYGEVTRIDNVVLTHPDGDHAAGLETILKEYEIGILWMNRPWNHIQELLPRFEYDYTETGLIQRLKTNYPYIANLEEICEERGIEIRDVFQGDHIGTFTVLSPTPEFYIDLVVESEKTPEPEREASIAGAVFEAVKRTVEYISSLWGAESLKGDSEGTSAENEMSVVQYASFNGGNETIVLTGDAGVRSLEIAYEHLQNMGVVLPGGIKYFQIPHHGSRRNVSSELLDKWFGERKPNKPTPEEQTWSAVISAHEDDPDHPRNATVRAFWHRGANVGSTENNPFIYYKPKDQPSRPGCVPLVGLPYPEEMEN